MQSNTNRMCGEDKTIPEQGEIKMVMVEVFAAQTMVVASPLLGSGRYFNKYIQEHPAINLRTYFALGLQATVYLYQFPLRIYLVKKASVCHFHHILVILAFFLPFQYTLNRDYFIF